MEHTWYEEQSFFFFKVTLELDLISLALWDALEHRMHAHPGFQKRKSGTNLSVVPDSGLSSPGTCFSVERFWLCRVSLFFFLT